VPDHATVGRYEIDSVRLRRDGIVYAARDPNLIDGSR
jgi:hypothetical protein